MVGGTTTDTAGSALRTTSGNGNPGAPATPMTAQSDLPPPLFIRQRLASLVVLCSGQIGASAPSRQQDAELRAALDPSGSQHIATDSAHTSAMCSPRTAAAVERASLRMGIGTSIMALDGRRRQPHCYNALMRLPTALGAVIACVAGLSALGDSPHQIYRVSDPDALRPAEVSVAINPASPDQIVAVSLQGGRPGAPVRISNYTYVSADGGRTWRTSPVPNDHQRVHGDDAITIARDGTAYHTYIAFDGIRVPRPDRASSGIYIRSSRDGVTWADPVAVVDHVNTAIPFEDKPWVGVDDAEESPHRGNVYVAWTRFDVYGSADPEHKTHIWFARSRDGVRTFTPPVQVSDTPGDARDSDDTVEGVVPSVGVKGEVYLAWAGPKGLVFDRSLDGGYTFGDDKVITTLPGGWDLPMPGIPRHNGMPVTGVDHSRGPNRGTIYINWIDERNGDADVFVIASRDGGSTWGAPVRVNDDEKGNKRGQLFTWMAVDPADGSINVVFLDRRDGDGTKNAVMLARSVDGGKTFVNHRVATEPFASEPNVFYGDYIGIDAHNGRVVAVYPKMVGGPGQLVLEAAVFRFKTGSQESP